MRFEKIQWWCMCFMNEQNNVSSFIYYDNLFKLYHLWKKWEKSSANTAHTNRPVLRGREKKRVGRTEKKKECMTGLRSDSNAALIFTQTHAFVQFHTGPARNPPFHSSQTHTHSHTANPVCFEQLEDTLQIHISINTEA